MGEAYIIDAIRTPTGRRKGTLADVHGADLGAFILRTLVDKHDIPAEDYDDVVFGCLDAVGPLAGNIARTAWLTAGLPEAIPGVTVDRQCGSSQQAVHFAAQGIMAGVQDLVIAGGVQTMTKIPISSAMVLAKPLGFNDPFSGSEGWVKRYGHEPVSQFHGAELIAEKWDISREEMEAYALASHQRAANAIDEGRFDNEVVSFNGLDMDETVRRDTTMEKMATLEPIQEGGRIHAGISSQTSDAASAMLLASEDAVKKYNLKPRARIHHMSVRGDDPIFMLTAPIPATEYALKKTGMSLDDIDLVEINEAFAPVPMAWLKETSYPHEKTNVNGGAIALGHPLGATGTKLMATLLNELERTGGRYGLQTMCEGGGVANVTIIERL
ncbi:acetyl-CoA acetyltransferases subfamily protein [alpha proteobacterium IMCC14465]|uniref:Acetyl-CoA acetyltransferases subfamily protein n=1 Tax=alpha proteobacterium IMCC14465 TaxID=1220535 RepID=J9DTV6_9PROT|nr:acetyl-CoA acetyltransferases subfamily protein [alpha proteobacterium IMCC14465]